MLRLENLNLLSRDPGATETANQFFRLTGKHRSGDYFDPTCGRGAGMFPPRRRFIFVWFSSANHSC